VIADIIEASSIEEKCVSVNFDPQEVQCSKLLIRTVLDNLIANAKKHGGINIPLN
jgi:signal transduction histidine kinase